MRCGDGGEIGVVPFPGDPCDPPLYGGGRTKVKEFTRFVYTGWLGEPEHLKIKTRLIDEKIANAMGEYVT